MSEAKAMSFVLHEGKRRRVLAVDTNYEPGRTLYMLDMGGRTATTPNKTIWADAEECEDWKRPPATRKLRDGDIVLEFDTRGGVALRKARSSKRYHTTLLALYHATVKAAVMAERARKAIEKRKGKRK